METIAGLPFFRLSFDDTGAPTDQQQLARLIDHVRSSNVARLAVVSHGWRNSEHDATALYTELFTNVAGRLTGLGTPHAEMPTIFGV